MKVVIKFCILWLGTSVFVEILHLNSNLSYFSPMKVINKFYMLTDKILPIKVVNMYVWKSLKLLLSKSIIGYTLNPVGNAPFLFVVHK